MERTLVAGKTHCEIQVTYKGQMGPKLSFKREGRREKKLLHSRMVGRKVGGGGNVGEEEAAERTARFGVTGVAVRRDTRSRTKANSIRKRSVWGNGQICKKKNTNKTKAQQKKKKIDFGLREL